MGSAIIHAASELVGVKPGPLTTLPLRNQAGQLVEMISQREARGLLDAGNAEMAGRGQRRYVRLRPGARWQQPLSRSIDDVRRTQLVRKSTDGQRNNPGKQLSWKQQPLAAKGGLTGGKASVFFSFHNPRSEENIMIGRVAFWSASYGFAVPPANS